MNKKNSYISLRDKIFGHMKYWKNFLVMINSVRVTFKNSSYILINAFQDNFPIQAQLGNGKQVILTSFNALYLIATTNKLDSFRPDYENDVLRISVMNGDKEIIFHGGINNGDISNIFVKNEYDFLEIDNKVVLDIGANIGDTSVFFAHKGAKKVIAIEPFPKNFELAKKNILSNKFEDVIQLVEAGCGSKNTKMNIDPEFESGIESKIKDFDNGVEVPIITIRDIIDRCSIPKNSSLKVDCEGCEYDIVENMSSEELAYFSNIQIEYHKGYESLKLKLKSMGYEVRVTAPCATNVINTFFSIFMKKEKNIGGKLQHEIGYAGFLYATKINQTN